MKKFGVVEKVDFTSGGAGNQWTTIDGIQYATFWNIMTKDWKVGDQVEFETKDEPFWYGQPSVLQAYNIQRVQA